jgi:Protein of unknown function (DUF2958)
MGLLPEDVRVNLPPLYASEGEQDPTVYIKFFTPWSNWSWYVIEGLPYGEGDFIFFGWVVGHERELGYFLISELESITGPGGLKIERDLHFKPIRLSDVKRQYEPGGIHYGQ